MNNPVLDYIMQRTLETENSGANYKVNNVSMPTFTLNVSKVGATSSSTSSTSTSSTSTSTSTSTTTTTPSTTTSTTSGSSAP